MLINKIVPVILIFISYNAVGQRNNLNKDHENFFRFGAKAGVNINKITGQSYNSGFNYNFQVGGFMQLNFSDVFGLQPEINFVQTQSEFSNDPNNVYDDLFGGGTQHKAKLNYLEVPLLLNINVGPSKRVKLQFGPAYGGLLKQTVDSLKSNGNIYKNSDWSAIGGLWIQLPLINIGARYKLGLTNINDIDDREKWKSQAIQIFAGVTF
ncbi:MAG: porin family protein [Ferruginibacter sp.]